MISENFLNDMREHREVLDDVINELFNLSVAFKTIGNEKMARDLASMARELNVSSIKIDKSYSNALYKYVDGVEADGRAMVNGMMTALQMKNET